MPAFVDITGQKFGLLTVQRREAKAEKTTVIRRWVCLCDCGTTSLAQAGDLKSGRHRSCGCLQINTVFKHGAARDGHRSTEYNSWGSMKNRCYRETHNAYPRYGGRGITVCDRWRESFENFLSDMGPKPSPKHSIDRIDVNGNYEPSNCRWATRFEQGYNKANTRRLEYDGKIWTTRELAAHLGVELDLFKGRVTRGNPISFSLENRAPARKWTARKSVRRQPKPN
jgi:hypothetical protein